MFGFVPQRSARAVARAALARARADLAQPLPAEVPPLAWPAPDSDTNAGVAVNAGENAEVNHIYICIYAR